MPFLPANYSATLPSPSKRASAIAIEAARRVHCHRQDTESITDRYGGRLYIIHNMSGKKPQFCKTCGRPLKGHVGQHGAKCKMNDVEDVDGALRSLNKPTSVSNLSQLRSPPHSTPTKVDSAINELSNQVAHSSPRKSKL